MRISLAWGRMALFGVCASFVLGWTLPAASETGDAMVEAVSDAVRASLRRHDVPGASVAIVKGGEVIWSGGFGVADRSTGAPVTADTVFETASLSKPVVAWAILRLSEQGKLNLDRPIWDYVRRWSLPASDFDSAGVTARSILAHAAGLSGGGDPGVEPGTPVPTLEQALDGAGLEGGPLRQVAVPGTRYVYSSKGYVLLELAVEEITGLNFADYVDAEILAPLGMTSSGFEPHGTRTATGHDWFGRPLPRYAHPTHAPGGLHATAADIGRFVAASMTGPDGAPAGRGVIGPGSVDITFAPYPLSDDSARVGLGYNLVPGDTALARKSGDHRGFKAILFSLPERGEGLVILSNSDRAAAGLFADVACEWNGFLEARPLTGICRQLFGLKTIHAGLALLILLLAAWLGWRLATGLRTGARAFASLRTPVRIALLCGTIGGVGLWWGFWYTDIPLRSLGYPRTFVTVRFDPWPTAMIWISWAITALAAVISLRIMLPRSDQSAR